MKLLWRAYERLAMLLGLGGLAVACLGWLPFALVLHPAPAAAPGGDTERVLRLLLAELPLKSAVKLAADLTGAPRNALYAQALQWQRDVP